MSKCEYAVIDGTTRKIKKKYAVIDGVTRKITKEYAVIDGTTKLIWSGESYIQYVQNTSDYYLYRSEDAINWTKTNISTPYSMLSASGNGNNVIILYSSQVNYHVSTDCGNTYSYPTLMTSFGDTEMYYPIKVTYGNGIYVMLYYMKTSNLYRLCWSTDMLNWTNCKKQINTPGGMIWSDDFYLPTYQYYYALSFANGYYILESNYGTYYSTNGSEYYRGSSISLPTIPPSMNGNTVYCNGNYFGIIYGRHNSSGGVNNFYYRSGLDISPTYVQLPYNYYGENMYEITTFKDYVYASSEKYMYKTNDGVNITRWNFDSNGITCLLNTGDRLYCKLSNGNWKFTDDGNTWNPISINNGSYYRNGFTVSNA